MNRIFTMASVAGLALVCVFATTSSAQNQAKGGPIAINQSRAEMFKNKIADLELNIEKIQSEINSNIESLNNELVSDIAYEDVYRRLHVQKVELTIDLKGLDARLDLLKKKAAESTNIQKRVINTTRELLVQKLENQKMEYKRLESLMSKGAVPKREVANAKQLLIEAELKLQQFMSESRQSSPAFVEALFETSLSIAERKAKLEAVQEMLSRHVNSRTQMEVLKQLMEAKKIESTRLQAVISELQIFETAQHAYQSAFAQQIFAMKAELDRLKGTYGSGHPKVVAVEKQLEMVQQQLANMASLNNKSEDKEKEVEGKKDEAKDKE